MLEHPRAVLHRTPLGIAGCVIEPRDPGVGNRSGTHRARLKRNPELAAIESLVAQLRRGRANRQHFGMGGRIVAGARRIVGACDNHAVLDHDRTDRHFPDGFAQPCLRDRLAHRFGKGPALHLGGSGLQSLTFQG